MLGDRFTSHEGWGNYISDQTQIEATRLANPLFLININHIKKKDNGLSKMSPNVKGLRGFGRRISKHKSGQ
jgi:hypothetical protein